MEKTNAFFEKSKRAALYSKQDEAGRSPFGRLLRAGVLTGIAVFSAACSLVGPSSVPLNEEPDPHVPVSPPTPEEQKYAQELAKIEKRFSDRLSVEMDSQFLKPPEFTAERSQSIPYRQLMQEFRENIPDTVPDYKSIDFYPDLTKFKPMAMDLRDDHDRIQACLVIPAETETEKHNYTPEIDADFGNHVSMSLPDQQLYTNYHELWHCVYQSLHPDYDNNDNSVSREDQFHHAYKSESFSDVGAAIDMLKDGDTNAIDKIREFRTIPLLIAPMNANAESSMRHYTIPALDALEDRIAETGLDRIVELEGKELASFVNEIVETSALSKNRLEMVTSLFITQPDDLNRWANEYAGFDKGSKEGALEIGAHAQRRLEAVLEKINPEKAHEYVFSQTRPAHQPTIYVDYMKELMKKIENLEKHSR